MSQNRIEFIARDRLLYIHESDNINMYVAKLLPEMRCMNQVSDMFHINCSYYVLNWFINSLYYMYNYIRTSR